MMAMSELITLFEPELLRQYSAQLLPSQLHALSAMKRCRTQLATCMLAQCDGCGQQRTVPHSCGHRSCPHCQHHESQQWLQRQLQAQVPATYFLITFTLPAELRRLAWQHQRVVYGLLMQCAWDTLKLFSHNDPQLRATPGAVAVLHTHNRRLDLHPHVHMAMPAAALDTQQRLWRTKVSRPNSKSAKKSKESQNSKATAGYLFNHKALAKVFRAKMLDAVKEAGLQLPAKLPAQWVVDCKAVGDGEKALVYLGRYLYRGVIQEKDIVRCADGKISFRYRDAKTGKTCLRTTSGADFLWLVLQHVLPKGLRRARNFGFLHPNSKRSLALLQQLQLRAPPCTPAWQRPRSAWVCACGQPMRILRRRMAPLHAHTAPATPPWPSACADPPRTQPLHTRH